MKRYVTLALWLFLYTVIIYHLVDYDNFPLSANYRFPVYTISVAYAFSLILMQAVEWYYQRVFQKNTNPKVAITKFFQAILLGCLLAFALTYSVLSKWGFDIYYILISLLLTAASAGFWILLVYGKPLLLKWTKLEGDHSISIKSGRTVHKVDFGSLSHFSSINKVVIAHLKSGRQIVTNFNLAELEDLLPEQFFRINRRFILNREVIDGVTSIENQKLEVRLKDPFLGDALVVSRYRASEFRKWLV